MNTYRYIDCSVATTSIVAYINTSNIPSDVGYNRGVYIFTNLKQYTKNITSDVGYTRGIYIYQFKTGYTLLLIRSILRILNIP